MLYGESILETVHRSAREELSVSIRAPKFLGYIEYDEKAHGGFGQIVGLVFMAQLKSGQLVPDKDATKAAFFRKLPPNIIPVQKAFLKKHWVEIMKK